MEITRAIPAWLDKTHPNFIRWERARNISIERGRFVKQVLEQFISAKNHRILDLGSGEGGTVKIFSTDNFVVSMDVNFLRLIRQRNKFDIRKVVQANAQMLPFRDALFDVIIIQDVIEHLENHELVIKEINRILKPEGIIFLSTPNRLSIINFLSDPHWGFPFIAVLNRNLLRKYFIRFFRKSEFERKDIPQLLSLKKITKLFSADYKLKLMTDFAVQELLNENKGIVWSDFHLTLISKLKSLKGDSIMRKVSNNNFGFVNKYLTPTFYILMKRKSYQFEFNHT